MDDVFEEKHSPEVGRYLVAKKSFKVGDKIFAEDPVVFAPGCPPSMEDFLCFGCCKVIKPENAFKCPRCKWYACSVNCLKEPWHTEYECTIFEKKVIQPSYVCLMSLFFLRSVIRKDEHSEKWKEITNITDVVEVQNDESKMHFKIVEKQLDTFLNEECGMNIDRSIIQKLMRTAMINTFEILPNDPNGNRYVGKALYSQCSLLMNDCDPTLEWIILSTNGDLGERWQLTLFARKDVNVGDTLSIAYVTGTLKHNTMRRRQMIRETLHFHCRCNRCKDSSELGTNMSAVICYSCSGIMLPAEPLFSGTNWRCIECRRERTNVVVRNLVGTFNRHMQLISENPNLEERCQQFDNLIKNCENKYQLYKNQSDVIRATVNWLQLVDLDKLLGNSVEVDTMYETLMTRAQNCADILSTVGAMTYWGVCEDIMAKAIVKYRFKSKDGRFIEDIRHSIQDKIEILNSIQQHLHNGIRAFRLFCGLKYKKLGEEMEEGYSYYAEKLNQTKLAGIGDT